MNMMEQYEKALLAFIQKGKTKATESNICKALFPKFNHFTTMLFNDTISHFEHTGLIVRMKEGGIVWWENNQEQG